MDNCNKWQKRKLQKLAKCMRRMYRYFGRSLFFTQKIAKFTARNSGKTCFEDSKERRKQQMYHLLFAMETGFIS